MDNMRYKKVIDLTMDTKKIAALLAAVDRGSLTAAAEELGYTQSGLTHMMNALETELGLNLLVRSKRGVRLSPAGQRLLPSMRQLTEAAAALEQEAAQAREQGSATLRLGAYASVARQWIPSVLAEFRRVSPDTDVVMDVGSITDLYEKLKNDELDCAIVSYQDGLSQGLHMVPLADDALLAILPVGCETENGCFPLSGFAGKEFLMPSFDFNLDIGPLFDGNLENIASRVRLTNLDDAAIASMVAHGLGVSILSSLIMRDIHEPVRAVPLDPPAVRRLCLAVSERRQNDRNIRRFVRCAQSVVVRMEK